MSKPDQRPAGLESGVALREPDGSLAGMKNGSDGRKPIPVRVMRFNIPMDALGLSVASSVSDRETKSAASKHRLQYLPWMRHFRLEFSPGNGKPEQISLIHESHVKSWDPAE
jgi:hypothetical protein